MTYAPATSPEPSSELPAPINPSILQGLTAAFGLALACGLPGGILPPRLRLLGICAAATGALVGWAIARHAQPPFHRLSSRRLCVMLLAVVAFGTTSSLWFYLHLRQLRDADRGTPQLHALQAAQSLTDDTELTREITEKLNQKIIESQEEYFRQQATLTGFLMHRVSGMYASPHVGWSVWLLEFAAAAIAAAAVYSNVAVETADRLHADSAESETTS